MTTMRPARRQDRADIQALRGIAVLLVVLNHGHLGIFDAGYLGVDIFFVISGFLITGMVKREIEAGTFRLGTFYFRRAKRLLPAAYVTFLATAALAPLLLASAELRDFHWQLLGAVSFTANVALWSQSGYFDGAAALKPLLHVWSLSLEEQYYLVLPATMLLLPRRYWVAGAIAVLVASTALCFALLPIKPVATFFMLPTRAWELAIGSVAALGVISGPKWRPVIHALHWPALGVLVLLPSLASAGAHPGLDALIVCLASVVVILRHHERMERTIPVRILAHVGDWSYSLYLVHWPIFAFLNNAYIGEPGTSVRVLAMLAALVIGYLLYRSVESPIRRMELQPSIRLVSVTVAASVALGVAPVIATTPAASAQEHAVARRAGRGFGAACDYAEKFVPRPECQSGGVPRVLVWGDSYAMHLIPGIVAGASGGVVQATRSVCGPFIGIALTKPAQYSRSWSEACLSFNRSVIDYLETAHSIDVVVLSSPVIQYVDPEFSGGHWGLVVDTGSTAGDARPSVAIALAAMRETISQVRALGKQVVLFAPPPSAGFDIGRCLDRLADGKVNLGPASACRVPVAAFERHQKAVLAFLEGLPNTRGVDVVRFDAALCGTEDCATELDGTPLYVDEGHLSAEGARMLARRMNWEGRLTSGVR